MRADLPSELQRAAGLRFGETGEGAGLRGADKICSVIAERGMAGAGAKTWRAFLSATTGGANNGAVNAIDRIGNGPWYDRNGRLLAKNKTDLGMDRPAGADAAIVNDLPNEDGISNHTADDPTCDSLSCPDNHDTLTGTGKDGKLYTGTTPATDATCKDWTSADPSGRPRVGHTWCMVASCTPAGTGSGTSWMSSLDEAGCAPGINIAHGNGSMPKTVGTGGGYGGICCFALTP